MVFVHCIQIWCQSRIRMQGLHQLPDYSAHPQLRCFFHRLSKSLRVLEGSTFDVHFLCARRDILGVGTLVVYGADNTYAAEPKHLNEF
jgi:hypothetical protein